jgi:hypothetical protein
MAACHPDQKHFAKDKCRSCYWRAYYAERPDQREKKLIQSRRRNGTPEAKAYDAARRQDPDYVAARAEYFRGHYQENKERYRVTRRQYRRGLRQEMIAAYGGVCSCCGEAEFGFLSLEHLNGDGKAHRMQFGERGNSDGIVRDLKRRGWPQDGYTVLCFNCNMGKAINGGTCPHEQHRAQLTVGNQPPAGAIHQGGIETPLGEATKWMD